MEQRRRLHWRLQPILLRAPAIVGKLFGRPLSVYLKLTLRCNARCLHCDVWKHPSAVGDELTTQEWKEFICSARRWLGPTHMAITGGEAMLKKDALDLLELAVEQGFLVEFLSNGYILTDEIAERIMKIDPEIMAVSLDALDAGLYDRLRGRAEFFERATNAIRLLVEQHRRLGAKCQIIIKSVVMEPNLDELTKIVDWIHELGTAKVMFQPITQNYEQEMNHDWYNVPELNSLWIKDAARAGAVIDKLIERLEAGAPIVNTRRHFELMKEYFAEPAKWARNMAFQIGDYADELCASGVSVMDVSPNGDLRTCPMCEPIGNVRDGSLRRTWRRRPACWKHPCPYW